jgi:hypothetical protein
VLLAKKVAQLIELVLNNCFATFSGRKFQCDTGIPTGMAACVLIANIYMDRYDFWFTNTLGDRASHYARLVDDTFFATNLCDTELLLISNQWNANIVWEITGTGRSVNFLDLTISITASGRLDWTMFRKPMNLYMYTPMASSHPPAVFKSIIRGEFTRIERRCRDVRSRRHHEQIFIQSLRERGYPINFIRQQATALKGPKPKNWSFSNFVFQGK